MLSIFAMIFPALLLINRKNCLFPESFLLMYIMSLIVLFILTFFDIVMAISLFGFREGHPLAIFFLYIPFCFVYPFIFYFLFAISYSLSGAAKQLIGWSDGDVRYDNQNEDPLSQGPFVKKLRDVILANAFFDIPLPIRVASIFCVVVLAYSLALYVNGFFHDQLVLAMWATIFATISGMLAFAVFWGALIAIESRS